MDAPAPAGGAKTSVRGVDRACWPAFASALAPETAPPPPPPPPLLALNVPSLGDNTCTVEAGASAKASAVAVEIFFPVAPSTTLEGEGGAENFPSPAGLASACRLEREKEGGGGSQGSVGYRVRVR